MIQIFCMIAFDICNMCARFSPYILVSSTAHFFLQTLEEAQALFLLLVHLLLFLLLSLSLSLADLRFHLSFHRIYITYVYRHYLA